jgi:hypothetical protein
MKKITQLHAKESLDFILNTKKTLSCDHSFFSDTTDISLVNSDYNDLSNLISSIFESNNRISTLLEHIDITNKVIFKTKKSTILYSDILVPISDTGIKYVDSFLDKVNEINTKNKFIGIRNLYSNFYSREKDISFNFHTLMDSVKTDILLDIRCISNNSSLKSECDHILNIIENSAFNKNSYRVNISLDCFASQFLQFVEHYNHKQEQLIPLFLDIKYVPSFQRDNDKWSDIMQIKFIENIIKGASSSLKLFSISGNDDSEFILDGLQRITAIQRFLNSDFKIFKDDFSNGFSYDEIISLPDLKPLKIQLSIISNLSIERFEFDSINDVINYYIEMNENITHSPDDILKAKKLLI